MSIDLSKLTEINNVLMNRDYNSLEKLFKIAAICREATEADRASVFACNRDRNVLWTVMADEVKGVIEVPTDSGIVGTAFFTKKPVLVNDIEHCNIHCRSVDENTGYKTINLLAYPVIGYDDIPLGVIEVLNKAGGFNDDDKKILHFAASQISTFLEILEQPHL